MVCAYKYRRVNHNDQVTRLRDCRAAALAAGRLADVAEFTRQLDELYAELGSERIWPPQAADREGQR
jgi:hypothetical protein